MEKKLLKLHILSNSKFMRFFFHAFVKYFLNLKRQLLLGYVMCYSTWQF